jgi:hypothetical protein
MDIARGITAVPGEPEQSGTAVIKMPDGTEIECPVLLDTNGAKFLDVRKLHPRYVFCGIYTQCPKGIRPGFCSARRLIIC